MQPWPMVPSDAGEKSDRRAQMYEWLDEEREKRVSVCRLSQHFATYMWKFRLEEYKMGGQDDVWQKGT